MANKTFVVQYLIKARDQFSRQANKVAHALKKVEKNTNKANKANSRLNKAFIGGMKRMAAAAVAFGGVALSAFGFSKLLTVGQQFQDSMLELGAITGATGKDFEFLRNESIKLAKASVTGQSEVARGIALVASAKPELLENLPLLTKTTEQILLLKNASGMAFADAARIGAESLNIFGKSAEETSKFVNILAAGSKFGSSLIAESGEAVVLAGGAARNAGLSFLDLNAAIQVAAKGGFKGARAGTALNSIFGRLSRKGADFEKDGLEGVFTKIKIKMDSMTSSTQRALYASELFGEEHSKVGFAILNNVKDLTRFQEVLKGTTVVQEQADRRMTSFSTKMKSMSIAINEKLIKAFERLEPTLTKYAEQFGVWLDTMDDGDIDKFVENIKGIAIAIDTVVSSLVKAIELFKKFESFSAKYVLPYRAYKFAKEKVFGEEGEAGSDQQIKDTSMKIMRDAPKLKTPADNLKSFLNIGVNVGLDKGLTQTGAAKVKSSGMMRAPNVGMTTEQPA